MNGSVLIADDEPLARRTLREHLVVLGWTGQIHEAQDGKTAIAVANLRRPDLVFLDIVMPEITGIDTLERLLQADTGARVVMVSSVGTEDTVRDCLKKGAKSFLQKPLQKEGMLNILKNVCQQTGVEL